MKSGVNYVVVLVSVTQENWMWSTAGYFEGRPPLGAPLNRGLNGLRMLSYWEPRDRLCYGGQDLKLRGRGPRMVGSSGN